MKDRSKYLIGVHGCDDTTEFIMELWKPELEVLKKMAEQCNNASHYPCMPVISIQIVTDEDDGEYTGEYIVAEPD